MARSKKINEDIKKKLFGTLINKNDTWENDPIFVKKTDEAKEFIKKHGLPEELTKKKNRKVK
jgi:hypothetical protein